MAEKLETKELAKPEKQLVDVHVEVSPPHWAYGHSRDPERVAESLENWAKELSEFVRDHRSQDSIGLEVVRDVQEVCSLCGRPWEPVGPDDESPDTVCAWCGAKVEEA